MGLSQVGPVVMDHRNPAFAWTSPPSFNGTRTCRISGQSTDASVKQLSELVANPERHQTRAGETGVLEYVHLTGDTVGAKRGWYLLSSFDESIDRPWDVTPFTPFSVDALHLGEVEAVVEFTSAQVPSDFDVVGQECVYPPFPVPFPLADGTLLIPLASVGPARAYDPNPHEPGARSVAGVGL